MDAKAEIIKHRQKLDAEAKALGEKLPEYRICAICLEYVKRSDYDDHLTSQHGYEIVPVTMLEE